MSSCWKENNQKQKQKCSGTSACMIPRLIPHESLHDTAMHTYIPGEEIALEPRSELLSNDVFFVECVCITQAVLKVEHVTGSGLDGVHGHEGECHGLQ